MKSLRKRLRAPAAPARISDIDPAGTPGAPGGRAKAEKELEARGGELLELGERLFAEGTRRVLLVLQGMDGSGKGGSIKHVLGQMNPYSVHVAAFKTPTEIERAHDFLWRIRAQVPPPGRVGAFDRSHYEDVLVVRVHELVAREVWEARYEQINEFERELAADGTAIVKAFLHISYDEQCRRMRRRLDRPDKRWKFNPRDLDERERWDEYVEAYEAVLNRCATETAPWYVVPADHKWYRNWALQGLLLETLRDLDPQYPSRPELDDAALKARLPCS